MGGRSLITTALLEPQSVANWSAEQWDLAIRQARRANLLSRLAHLLAGAGLVE